MSFNVANGEEEARVAGVQGMRGHGSGRAEDETELGVSKGAEGGLGSAGHLDPIDTVEKDQGGLDDAKKVAAMLLPAILTRVK